MDKKALYKLTYGLFLLTAKDGGKDNGCIINTAIQVANNPTRLSIAAIKGNLTHDMLLKSGECNLSAISSDAPFELFQRFGLQSGRDVDKFADFPHAARSENGLYYLTDWANAYFSLKVTESHDLGSHTLFIAEVVDAAVLSSVATCTYGYYQSTIKKSAPKPAVKKGWRCKVCGYVYEGDPLPEDYLCPLCKHGPEDFEYFEIKEEPKAQKTWVCTVCGYEHVGDAPPEICPLCKQGADKFVEKK